MALTNNKNAKSKELKKTTKTDDVLANLQQENFKMEELLKGFEGRNPQAIFKQIPVLEEAFLKGIAKITFSQDDFNLTEGIDEAEMARLNIEDAKAFLRSNLKLVSIN